jgi:beta-lactamase regulating signal transducer with metallopeptidase domain
MMPLSHLIDQATAVLATAFVAGLWQGTALTLLVAALLRMMPRASAGLRHTLLLISFVAALLLPFVRLAGANQAAANSTHALPIASWVAAAIACLWIAAAGARALQLLMAWSHLRTVRREATPITLEGTAGFTAGNRQARLCTSAAVDSPTILGFWKPALLLPEWMAPKLSPDELRQIALHECEHLRRHDDWLNLLLQIALVLSPLNPGLLWLNRRIGVQRELACDDAVVTSTGEPIAYASCLARLAEQRLQQRGRLRLALAAWERKSELAQRVHALLQQPSRWTTRQSGAASAAAAVLLLGASAGLARAPRLIRIVSAPVVNASNVSTAPAAASAVFDRVVAANSGKLQGAGPVRMVQTSFTLKPVQAGLHKPAAKLRPVAKRKPNEQSQSQQPHILRTSAVFQQKRVLRTADFDSDTTVRFVTADFTPSYVAVPIASGWLLIEL